MRFGENLTSVGIRNDVVDLEAIFVFNQSCGNLDRVSGIYGAYVFDAQVDNRPRETAFRHFTVAEGNFLEQGRTRLLEKARVIAMPHDPHRIEIIELNLDDDLG